MMKGRQWLFLVAAVTAGAALALLPALGGHDPDIGTRYGWRNIASGDWTFGFGNVGVWIETSAPVTGFAFGPGRDELAYCAPDKSGSPSALWTVHISFSQQRSGPSGFDFLSVSPRLVATPPPETTFRGPLWWSPDGSRIALVIVDYLSGQLVIVDYLSGQITAVPDSENVVEAAWSPDGGQIALVREKEGTRSVWVYSRETGESRRLGAGGYDLRWSLDGTGLHWLRDDSQEAWTAVRWGLRTGTLETGGPRPARAEGALWSPDGQLCATLEAAPDEVEDQIVVYPRNSTLGDTVSLPGLEPEKLLGWSPDSKFLLALARGSTLAVVSARPPGAGVRAVTETTREYADTRATVSGWAIGTEAGPPAWSSSGKLLVYPAQGPFGTVSRRLVVHPVQREYAGGSALPGRLERKIVTHNLRVIMLSMLMYLNDWDLTFPYSDDPDYLRTAISTYIRDESVFMRPGTENSVVVSFTIDPGAPLSSVEDPASTPIATIDYSPDFYGVAYLDGHVEIFEKK